MPDFAMTQLEIAAKVYKIDPSRFGDTRGLRFVVGAVAAGDTSQAKQITVQEDRLLLAVQGSPNDGAAASYAGLELEFIYGEKSFCTDGNVSQFMPFSSLSGRGPGPTQIGGGWYWWEVPILLPRGTVLSTRVKNTTAGALTPSVIAKTVELRG